MFAGKLGMRRGGTDHRTYEYLHGGRTVAHTKISTGSGYDIYSSSLVQKVAMQLHVNSSQLVELVACNMSQVDYEAHLRSQNLIP